MITTCVYNLNATTAAVRVSKPTARPANIWPIAFGFSKLDECPDGAGQAGINSDADMVIYLGIFFSREFAQRFVLTIYVCYVLYRMLHGHHWFMIMRRYIMRELSIRVLRTFRLVYTHRFPVCCLDSGGTGHVYFLIPVASLNPFRLVLRSNNQSIALVLWSPSNLCRIQIPQAAAGRAAVALNRKISHH